MTNQHFKPICKKKTIAEVFSPEIADQQNTQKNPQIANLQIWKFSHLQKVCKSTNLGSPQVCGFAEFFCKPPK
jgi:hypothetical protein